MRVRGEGKGEGEGEGLEFSTQTHDTTVQEKAMKFERRNLEQTR